MATMVRKQSSHPPAELSAALQDRLERLPRGPGVYLLRDREGTVIYVGKAKNLHQRVRSYFLRSGDERAFVALLTQLLGDIETVVTANEKEALLLENTLIKEHRPRFNVMMRDDKEFLVLRLDASTDFPRLEVVRRIRDDGARYFGPYDSATACRETVRIVNRYFSLRTCSDRALRTRQRPCLQFQMGRCPAPCVLPVAPADYARQVEDVTLFLRGRYRELVIALEERMLTAAEELNFEHAANLRDQLQALERTLVRQEVVGVALRDQDVFALYREGAAVEIAVLKLREGKLLASRTYSFRGHEFPNEELLSSFIGQYYDRGAHPPAEVLCQLELDDAAAKAEWLGERAGSRVTLLWPQRGHKRQLVRMAERNAEHAFVSRRERGLDREQALEKLRQRLRLRQPPRHIECYDISQLMGRDVVASMVVMRDTEPDPSSYRHFRLRIASDDFGALYETLSRRLRHARLGEQGWDLPDLIVVDGGRGQLSAALAALKDAALEEAGLHPPAIVGLAKERYGADAQGDERPDRVFLAGAKEPIRLGPNTSEIFVLSRLRDEAHRFAITHHKKVRQRRSFHSSLDEIAGIGDKRKKELLRHFGSVRAISGASLEALSEVNGLSRRAAEAVYAYYSARGGGAAASPTDSAPGVDEG